MRRARPLPYFAEAPITTIVAVVVTAAVAIDGLVMISEAGLPRPLRTLAALVVVGVVAPLAVVYEIAGPPPVLIPALRRILRRRP